MNTIKDITLSQGVKIKSDAVTVPLSEPKGSRDDDKQTTLFISRDGPQTPPIEPMRVGLKIG